MPLMKTISFNIICSLIFGIERGPRRDAIKDLFQYMMEGMLSIPLNLPFTRFNRSLQASAKIKAIVKELVREKKEALESDNASPRQDLITCLLSRKTDDSSDKLSDQEIVDNVIVLLIAGHDTSSVLLAFLVRLFAIKPSIYADVAQGTLLTPSHTRVFLIFYFRKKYEEKIKKIDYYISKFSIFLTQYKCNSCCDSILQNKRK